jgi:hypothetical protein
MSAFLSPKAGATSGVNTLLQDAAFNRFGGYVAAALAFEANRAAWLTARIQCALTHTGPARLGLDEQDRKFPGKAGNEADHG